MAQISRPFQIALAVVVLFAGVWLFVLQGHSSSGSGSGSSAPSASAPSASKSSAPASATASSTHIYHGPAPGLEGLTRAIVRAHQAVAASGEAPQQPSSSTPGSGKASAPAASAPATNTESPSAKSVQPKSASSAQAKSTPKSSSAPGASTPTSSAPKSSSSASTPLRQVAIEADLKAGIPVVVLFWNPHGAEDVVDHHAVARLVRNDIAAHRPVAVQEATASQVAEFGSITRGVQIDATPTILVIGQHDQAIVLTGVQDAFALEQTIEEALHPQPHS